MLTDIWTIIWKDWQEWLFARGARRGGLIRVAVLISVFGVLLPLQSKRAWVESPVMLLYWAWVPVFLVASMVADAIAGERERRTLETLLASRMSDLAILLGKVMVTVLYGWGIAVVSLLVGLVVTNLAYGQGHLLLYPSMVVLGGGVIGLLTCLLTATAGVLVSLRAPTVRHASQTLSLITLTLYGVPLALFGGLATVVPVTRQAVLYSQLGDLYGQQALWCLVAFLVLADGILLLAARARFQRARLILN